MLEPSCGTREAEIEPSNFLEQLKRKELKLELALKKVQAGIKSLEDHPEINEVLKTLSEATRY